MLDVSNGSETVPAWNVASLVPGTRTEQPPDLRLHLVHAASGTLTVEVASGDLDAANGTLLVGDLGEFEVTATLRRLVDGRERVYLRLRSATSWDPGAA